ncbi:hypothetical protein LTR53_012892, partial [Teratosphaeriaceae sp. CCFEE 6253]
IGRPLLIDDDDCDVSEPTPVDEDGIRPTGIIMPPAGQMAPNGLVAVIPVVRITAQMKKTLKSRTIAATTLNTYDDHFASIMASYPDPFPIHSPAYLDPRLLTAACALQTTRFFLYRHNLSAACRRSDRTDALDRCVAVAQDTAHYVQRSMQPVQGATGSAGFYSPAHMASWAARLRTMAPAFFCAHLWRCTLILCLRMEYNAALTLVQASAAVGDMRKNNIACGRHLTFFLDKLIGRLREGATREAFETDEEMLAYASGDLQGCAEESWAWTGSETGANLNQMAGGANGYASDRHTPPTMHGAADAMTPGLLLSEREMQEWGGWEHVQRTLQSLLQDQQQQQQQQGMETHPGPMPGLSSMPPPPGSAQAPPPPPQLPPQPAYMQTTPTYPRPDLPPMHPSGGPTLPPLAPSLQQTSASPVPSNGGSSRISIRDIM